MFFNYYIRNVSGNVMAIYSDASGNMVLAEQPVYGAGRIGIAYNGNNNQKNYVYELADHLGNVRVVFTKEDNDAVLEGFTDYYPGGMAMPNRNMEDANGYRYGYQGQYAETDPETGKEVFQLRLWDGRIGRWLTTDPYGQYASPYLGMGNNPISMMDPDGGFADGCCDDDWVSNGINELDEVTMTGTDMSEGMMRGLAGLDLGFSLPNNFLGPRTFEAPKIIGRNRVAGIDGSTVYHNPGASAISLDFDFASPSPKPITDSDGVEHFGRSLSIGLVTDDFGKTKFFMTVKDATDPGMAFGFGVQAGGIQSVTNRPFLVSDFAGSGVESSGALFLGLSVSTDRDIMDYAKEPNYMMHGIQFGAGIPFGYANYRTNTNVYD